MWYVGSLPGPELNEAQGGITPLGHCSHTELRRELSAKEHTSKLIPGIDSNSHFLQVTAMEAIKSLISLLLSLAKETLVVAKDLFIILIPAILIVKLLQETGVIAYLSLLLEPMMQIFGLPGETAIVFATAMFVNIYGAIAVFMMIAADIPFSVAQSTVLWTMILICHTLPVELALTHRVGGHFLFLGPLRFIGACVCGVLLHQLYTLTGTLEQVATLRWSEQKVEHNLVDWAFNQVNNLVTILIVLFCLLTMMRFLNYIKFTHLLGVVLNPLLRLMGISKKGASIAVFGLLAGITFGSGLLLAEINKNAIPRRDIVLVLAFLSLCHGVIEDTALAMLLGADISGLLFFRLFFAILVLAILSRLPVLNLDRFSSTPAETNPQIA